MMTITSCAKIPGSSFVRSFLFFLIVLLLAGCHRQEIQTRVLDLEDRLNSLELRTTEQNRKQGDIAQEGKDTLQDIRQKVADFKVEIDEIRTEIQILKGKVEMNAYNILELGDSLKKSPKQIGPTTTTTTSSEQTDKRVESLVQRLETLEKTTVRLEQELVGLKNIEGIEIGSSLFHQGDYTSAITTLSDYLKRYPKSRKAGQAKFLLAESYYHGGEYLKAIAEYQEFIEQYKDGEFICTAYLRQGLSFMKLGETKEAKIFLKDVTAKCPKNSAEAKEAAKVIESISDEKPRPAPKSSAKKRK